MRLSVASLRRMIKGSCPSSSCPGLDVVQRAGAAPALPAAARLPRRLRAACASTGGDYGGGRSRLLSCPCSTSGRAAWSTCAMSPAIP